MNWSESKPHLLFLNSISLFNYELTKAIDHFKLEFCMKRNVWWVEISFSCKKWSFKCLKYLFQLDSPKKFALFRDSPKKREMENLRSDINRMKRNVDSLVEMQVIAQTLIIKKEERLEELQKPGGFTSPKKEKPWIQRRNFYNFFVVVGMTIFSDIEAYNEERIKWQMCNVHGIFYLNKTSK